jgi:hypothetical protein
VEAKYADAFNAATAFQQYKRFFPTPRCGEPNGPAAPPVLPYYLDEQGNQVFFPLGENINANPATLQGVRCSLPNRPDNPVLPG